MSFPLLKSSEQLSVDITTVAYRYHQNDQSVVLHIADNARIPNPISPKGRQRALQGLAGFTWIVEYRDTVFNEVPDAMTRLRIQFFDKFAC